MMNTWYASALVLARWKKQGTNEVSIIFISLVKIMAECWGFRYVYDARRDWEDVKNIILTLRMFMFYMNNTWSPPGSLILMNTFSIFVLVLSWRKKQWKDKAFTISISFYMIVLKCWSFRYMWGVCQHDNSFLRRECDWHQEIKPLHLMAKDSRNLIRWMHGRKLPHQRLNSYCQDPTYVTVLMHSVMNTAKLFVLPVFLTYWVGNGKHWAVQGCSLLALMWWRWRYFSNFISSSSSQIVTSDFCGSCC